MFQSQSSGPHRKVLRTLLVHSKDAILQMCFFQLWHIMAILDHEVDVDLGIAYCIVNDPYGGPYQKINSP